MFTDQAMRQDLSWLGFSGDVIDAIVHAAPGTLAAESGVAIRRYAQVLIDDMGGYGKLDPWPSMPSSPYFDVFVFLATFPFVRKYHSDHGIPEEISRDILSSLSRLTEPDGSTPQDWLNRHFRGALYRLGRLEFERGKLGVFALGARADGEPASEEEPGLHIHIPGDLGPVTPESCDRSFERAKAFFAEHFPEETYRLACCESWMLDEQLADYLPEDSNLVRFQRRFTLLEEPWGDGNREILSHVFNLPADTPLDDVPQRTTLERAFVAHIRAGKQWKERLGRLSI